MGSLTVLRCPFLSITLAFFLKYSSLMKVVNDFGCRFNFNFNISTKWLKLMLETIWEGVAVFSKCSKKWFRVSQQLQRKPQLQL